MKREDLQNRLNKIFQYLHEHPEVSWHEHNTTTYITKFLEAEGISYKTFDDRFKIPALFINFFDRAHPENYKKSRKKRNFGIDIEIVILFC